MPCPTDSTIIHEDRRETNMGKVPLAAFPPSIPGQCNEPADNRDFEEAKVPVILAASVPPVCQDMEAFSFLLGAV